MTTWTRSPSYETGPEVALVDGRVVVRDSKYGEDSNTQEWSPARWNTEVLAPIRRDEDPAAVRRDDDGAVYLGVGPAPLFFTTAEWDAFVEAVLLWEFEMEKL